MSLGKRKTIGLMAAIVNVSCGSLLCVSGQIQYLPNIVIWSADTNCRSTRLANPGSLKFSCSYQLENDRSIRVVDDGKIKLSVALGRSRNRIVVRTKIENNGTEKVASDFARWYIAHYESETSFLHGKRPIFEGNSLQTSAPPAVQSLTDDPFEAPKVIEIRTAADPQSPSRQANPSLVRRLPVVLPITKSIGDAKPSVPNAPQTNRTMFKDRAMTKKSVSPGNRSNGIVYFNRIPNSEFQLVFLHIGQTTYVFELH